MNKKLVGVFFIFTIILLSVSLISASWFGDFWKKITGNVVEETKITPTSASAGSSYNSYPSNVLDGDSGTYWSAGKLPTAYITIDLGAEYNVSKIKLLTEQSPDGYTVHNIYSKNSSTYIFSLVHSFSGSTTNSQWLEKEFSPLLQNVRYIKVSTTSSPSWVAWKEIEVYSSSETSTPSCTPNCDGKSCGDDGCGSVCGICSSGQTCNTNGQCISTCMPSCSGKQCGSDGCDGSCGSCSSGKLCNANGQCYSPYYKCIQSSDCGSEIIFNKRCSGNSKCYDSKIPYCLYPATINAYCYNKTKSQCSPCTSGTICQNGECVVNQTSSTSGYACSSMPCFFNGTSLHNSVGYVDSPPTYTSAKYPYEFTLSSESNVVMNLKYQVWKRYTYETNILYIKIDDGSAVFTDISPSNNIWETANINLGKLEAGTHTIQIYASPASNYFMFDWFDLTAIESSTSCTPNCAGKVCGSNGCGGNCGTCPSGKSCNANGLCVTSNQTTSGCIDSDANEESEGIYKKNSINGYYDRCKSDDYFNNNSYILIEQKCVNGVRVENETQCYMGDLFTPCKDGTCLKKEIFTDRNHGIKLPEFSSESGITQSISWWSREFDNNNVEYSRSIAMKLNNYIQYSITWENLSIYDKIKYNEWANRRGYVLDESSGFYKENLENSPFILIEWPSVDANYLYIIQYARLSEMENAGEMLENALLKVYPVSKISPNEISSSQGTESICSPEYSLCKIEPVECPSTEKQKVICENECGGEDRITEVSCEVGECGGCLLDGECYEIGYREDEKYCSYGLNFVEYSDERDSCKNDYECKNNFCLDNKCVNAKEELEKKSRLIEVIVNLYCALRHPLSEDEENKCLNNYLS